MSRETQFQGEAVNTGHVKLRHALCCLLHWLVCGITLAVYMEDSPFVVVALCVPLGW